MISPTPHQIAQLQIIFRQSRVGQPCLANPFTEQELAELNELGLVRNVGTDLSITEHAVLALGRAGCVLTAAGEDVRRPLIVVTRFGKGSYGWGLFHQEQRKDSDADYRGVAPCLLTTTGHEDGSGCGQAVHWGYVRDLSDCKEIGNRLHWPIGQAALRYDGPFKAASNYSFFGLARIERPLMSAGNRNFQTPLHFGTGREASANGHLY